MAKKLKTREIKLPHPGFYNSIYSSEIDTEESNWLEYECEERKEGEIQYPETLRIDQSDMAEMLIRFTDYTAAYRELAIMYVDALSTLAGEALEISAPEKVKFYCWQEKRHKSETRQIESLRLTFADMSSPRYYNFETDRVFANIPVSVIRKLWRISKDDGHETLTRIARERHSSRSGFISHYSPFWREWGDVNEWDHNQLETLLIAACEIGGFDLEDSGLSIYYATVDHEGGYTAWSNAVDWPALESAMIEKRAELLAEWIEEDSEKARAWIANNAEKAGAIIAASDDLRQWEAEIPYRCPKTLDLFANLESRD